VNKYLFRLFIAGQTPRARQAIDNISRICEERLPGQYEMVVVDVLEEPQLAEDERIIATPTLIKSLPPPLRRIIGDLSDTKKVLLGLDLPLIMDPFSPGSKNDEER
jgi:circadian clock protein KaiB